MQSSTYAPEYNHSKQQQGSWDRPKSQMSSSSDSSSDDGSKKKRRSHRPRGCRGGGSRRARKERREQLFLAQQQQKQATTSSSSSSSTLSTGSFLPPMKTQNQSKEESIVFHECQDLLPALAPLGMTSSFSSSGSSESPDTYFNSKSFDILPSMPAVQPSTSVRRGNSYKTMSALPPLTSATSYKTKPNNISHIISNIGYKCDPIQSTTIVEDISNNSHYPELNYHAERIKKQQDMLAGGGSLFSTSPRSFLMGKKKAPFCF